METANDEGNAKRRLVIVSNRLPFTIVERKGEFKFKESAGGLVSGIRTYLNSLKSDSGNIKEQIWVGWPGIAANDEAKEKLRSKALSEFQAYPIFIPQADIENFYNGFCNNTIWPIFHYFPSYTVYNEDYWISYKKINEIFCEELVKIIKPDDVVWIHDYHLMLLPKLIRERVPNCTIGFFLHIPFPSYELFRLLPSKWRIEILEGLLGADLVGFHTHDYTHYFLKCVFRILGYEQSMGQITLNDRIVKADTFPMGIDFKRFNGARGIKKVQKEIAKLEKTFPDCKIILSIDRLDYTKGIVNRLQGYELFLEKNPQWHNKVTLLLVLVPSRTEVKQYQKMKRQIDGIIGRINGGFGKINWTPIVYQYKPLVFNPLVALYIFSNVALVTPLRDGMNLVAKEYIAAKTDKKGVLILSEMAGASKELRETIIINPNNIKEIADALKEALEMPDDEQVRRNNIAQKRLTRYDIVRWGNEFIGSLLSVEEEQKKFNARLLPFQIREQIIKDFKTSEKRLLLLDYDGTLVPFANHPQIAKPGEELLTILRKLSEDKRTEVIIISGRDKNTLESWFGNLNLGLIAEHGILVKEKNKEWSTTKVLVNEWKTKLLPVLEMYSDRLPGSFVEEKEFSIAWHYRKTDPELSSVIMKELVDNLANLIINMDVQILKGNKVVEIRTGGVNKGSACTNLISKNNFDFILAIGDDLTDEDIFKILPEKAYSVRVGMTSSHAKFNLYTYSDVRRLLEEISK